MDAKYVGENGSMGFRTGVTYNIKTESKIIKRNRQPVSSICVFDTKSGNWCPYESLEAVMRNWEIVNRT